MTTTTTKNKITIKEADERYLKQFSLVEQTIGNLNVLNIDKKCQMTTMRRGTSSNFNITGIVTYDIRDFSGDACIGNMSTGRITIYQAGYYQICFQAFSQNTGSECGVAIRKNTGITILFNSTRKGTSTGYESGLNMVGLEYLDVNDQVYAEVTIGVLHSFNNCYFTVIRVF